MLILLSNAAHAGFIQYFKDEQGETNWQYVANFSSAVLITLLSITAITLFFSHRRTRKANAELQEIRNVLEQRVKERTATLNESNRLLQESNQLLEGEISHHKQTAERLKASEAYTKNILESMPLMLVGLDRNHIVTQWNGRAEEYTNVATEEAIGRDLWKAYPSITVSPDQVAEVMESHRPVTIKQSQRGQFYYDITIYPLSGEVDPGVVILIDDVTQRTMAENMLIQRDKMSSMGELASTMAHDINTPLQAILGDVQQIQQSLAAVQADPAIIDALHKIADDAAVKGRQATATVANLLSFAHSQEDHKQLLDVSEVIDRSVGLANEMISEPTGLHFKDIDFQKHYEKGLPSIPGYVSELQQVFLSLFRHACHSLGGVEREGHSPMIRVEVTECYDAIWIKVQHNGRGLNSDEQQDIFEPFFKNATYESSTDVAKRLSFSYFIITEHHRGQMAVTSDPDVGTTFHIQLQLK